MLICRRCGEFSDTIICGDCWRKLSDEETKKKISELVQKKARKSAKEEAQEEEEEGDSGEPESRSS